MVPWRKRRSPVTQRPSGHDTTRDGDNGAGDMGPPSWRPRLSVLHCDCKAYSQCLFAAGSVRGVRVSAGVVRLFGATACVVARREPRWNASRGARNAVRRCQARRMVVPSWSWSMSSWSPAGRHPPAPPPARSPLVDVKPATAEVEDASSARRDPRDGAGFSNAPVTCSGLAVRRPGCCCCCCCCCRSPCPALQFRR